MKDTANTRNANWYSDRREHLGNDRNNKIRRIDTELSRSEFGTDSFSEEDLDNENFSEGKGSSASLSQRSSSKRHQKYFRKLPTTFKTGHLDCQFLILSELDP